MMQRIYFLMAFTFLMVGKASAATVLQEYKAWTAHVHGTGSEKVCFATSIPKKMLPTNVNRGQVVFYVTIWPADDIRNEPSVSIGYKFKKDNDSRPTVTIGSDEFTMFSDGDKAFVSGKEDEQRLVALIKSGDRMVVSGVSERGTKTTDTYSLAGSTAAIDRINKECK
jgi:hypothetical protein